jgi:hypothetical protein
MKSTRNFYHILLKLAFWRKYTKIYKHQILLKSSQLLTSCSMRSDTRIHRKTWLRLQLIIVILRLDVNIFAIENVLSVLILFEVLTFVLVFLFLYCTHSPSWWNRAECVWTPENAFRVLCCSRWSQGTAKDVTPSPSSSVLRWRRRTLLFQRKKLSAVVVEENGGLGLLFQYIEKKILLALY